MCVKIKVNDGQIYRLMDCEKVDDFHNLIEKSFEVDSPHYVYFKLEKNNNNTSRVYLNLDSIRTLEIFE